MVTKQHRCPKCGDLAPWSTANPFRPFCSERCKLTDLGAWATGQYGIASSDPVEGGPSQPGDERGD